MYPEDSMKALRVRKLGMVLAPKFEPKSGFSACGPCPQVGPQQTLYIPHPVLRRGQNEVGSKSLSTVAPRKDVTHARKVLVFDIDSPELEEAEDMPALVVA